MMDYHIKLGEKIYQASSYALIFLMFLWTRDETKVVTKALPI